MEVEEEMIKEIVQGYVELLKTIDHIVVGFQKAINELPETDKKILFKYLGKKKNA